MGVAYEFDEDAPNIAEAVRWFRLSAQQGNPAAQCYLGIFYQEGKGIPQDPEEAIFWYIEFDQRRQDTAFSRQ